VFFASALLALAISIEVAATAVLPRAESFTNPFWSAVVLLGYGTSIWLLTVVVREVPVSVAYAVWSGLGTALVAIVGTAWLGEPLTGLKVAALLMIICGVVLLNLGAPHAAA
jgi:small multidrug resistance pump